MLTCATTLVRDVLGAMWRADMPHTLRRNWLCHECADEIDNAEFAVCDRCWRSEQSEKRVADRMCTGCNCLTELVACEGCWEMFALRPLRESQAASRKKAGGADSLRSASVLARNPSTVANVKRAAARMRRKA